MGRDPNARAESTVSDIANLNLATTQQATDT